MKFFEPFCFRFLSVLIHPPLRTSPFLVASHRSHDFSHEIHTPAVIENRTWYLPSLRKAALPSHYRVFTDNNRICFRFISYLLKLYIIIWAIRWLQILYKINISQFLSKCALSLSSVSTLSFKRIATYSSKVNCKKINVEI